MIEKMCRLSMAVPESLGMDFIDFLQADGRVHLILPSEEPRCGDLAERLVVLREKLRAVVETLEEGSVLAVAEDRPAAADAEVERILCSDRSRAGKKRGEISGRSCPRHERS